MKGAELIKYLDEIGLTPETVEREGHFAWDSDIPGEAGEELKRIRKRMEEIESRLGTLDSWRDPEHSRLSDREYEIIRAEEARLLEPCGPWTLIKRHGGHEGASEIFYIVIHFPKIDVYLRADGWYLSYEGTHIESGWHEVQKKQKVIDTYE